MGKEKQSKGERTEIQRERSEGKINCGVRERGKKEDGRVGMGSGRE